MTISVVAHGEDKTDIMISPFVLGKINHLTSVKCGGISSIGQEEINIIEANIKAISYNEGIGALPAISEHLHT
jgi:hypothetical protein